MRRVFHLTLLQYRRDVEELGMREDSGIGVEEELLAYRLPINSSFLLESDPGFYLFTGGPSLLEPL